jgi:histidinol-phosphate phosphatase family protein
MRQAVILAGGKGTRLRERLHGRPKPLVDVDGAPLLGRQIEALHRNNISNIVVLAGHAADQIEAFCADPALAELRLRLLEDGELRGTAGALLHAFDYLADRFLVVYGDTLFEIDLDRLWNLHLTTEADATLVVHPNDHPFDSDLVEMDEFNRVIAIHRLPRDPNALLPNLVNAGMYVLEREAIAFWHEQHPPTDIARDLFPAMLHRGANLRGYPSFEYIKDLGTPKRLDKAISDLRSGVVARSRIDRSQKAVFLDRDGTINEWRGHLARAEDFALIKGAAEAVKQLNEAEYRVIVVTNQPVIARGETTFEEVRRIHWKMETLLGEQRAFIDRLYLCPHHPDKGFPGEVATLKVACDCRKPETGLIEKACDEFNIDSGESWFIGDTTADMLAAQRTGLRSILVETGEAGRDGKYVLRPDFIAKDLHAAVSFITLCYEPIARALAPIAQRLQRRDLVLIGGLARQGKSTLASVLRHTLLRTGFDAQILPLDGFLRDRDQHCPSVLGRFGLEAAKTALQDWLDSETVCDINVPIYNRLAGCRSSKTMPLHLTKESVLIVEGGPALLLDLPGRWNVTRVFVHGDKEGRRSRVVDDLVAHGIPFKEAQRIYNAREIDEAPMIVASEKQVDFALSLDTIFTDCLSLSTAAQ